MSLTYKFTLRWKQLMLSKWVECTLHVTAIDNEWLAEMIGHTDHAGISITPYHEDD